MNNSQLYLRHSITLSIKSEYMRQKEILGAPHVPAYVGATLVCGGGAYHMVGDSYLCLRACGTRVSYLFKKYNYRLCTLDPIPPNKLFNHQTDSNVMLS